MKALMKSLLIFSALLFMAFMPHMAAATSPDYEILNIEVNDIDTDDIQNLDVERGEILQIEVMIRSLQPSNGTTVDDVFVEAKIIGYEFGSVSDLVGPFSIDPGLTYKKTLTIQIPEDIDATQLYTLRIEVSDPINEDQKEFSLHIDEQRHDLNIFDIILSSYKITAGQPLFVDVNLENLGEKEEDQIKVTATIPKLGITTSTYVNELVTELQEENEQFKSNEDSSRTQQLMLRIPEDAEGGDYSVEVTVEYNRGHSVVKATRTITVQAKPAPEVMPLITADATSKQAKPGESVTYKIQIANLGVDKELFAVQLDGVPSQLDALVEDSFINIMGESTGMATIKVVVAGDAAPDTYRFLARVMRNSDVIQEIPLNVVVKGATPAVVSAPGKGVAFKDVLAVIFALLIVSIIVLGLIIAFRKMKEEGEETSDEETPVSATDAQTYYFKR